MTLPPQLNFLTLACRDVQRMAEFVRALGWPEAPSSEPVHRVFQLSNGVVLALYGADHYERDHGGARTASVAFHDPEGNIWDVAWKDGSHVDERGALTWDSAPAAPPG